MQITGTIFHADVKTRGPITYFETKYLITNLYLFHKTCSHDFSNIKTLYKNILSFISMCKVKFVLILPSANSAIMPKL